MSSSTDAAAQDLIALIYTVMAQHESNRQQSERGVIVPGSYNSKDGTVQVLIGTTAAIIPTAWSQPLAYPKLPLMTPVHGMQAGPKGGERCVVVKIKGGRGVYLVHDMDDSPGAPAGEYWYVHPDSKSSIKVTNDGPTQGDALGGVRMHGAAYHGTTTGSGHAVTLDDVAKTLKIVSAGGQAHTFDDNAKTISNQSGAAKTIVDGNGNAISHVAQTVGLGALASSIPSAGAVYRQSDAQALASNIVSQTLQSLAGNLASAMTAAGIPNAGAFAAIVQAAGWVVGNVTPPTIPSGSATVKAV